MPIGVLLFAYRQRTRPVAAVRGLCVRPEDDIAGPDFVLREVPLTGGGNLPWPYVVMTMEAS